MSHQIQTPLVHTYIEDGYKPIPYIRLSGEEYARALQSVVVACTDVLPYNKEERLIYLAHRQAKPMVGWWLIGGKMLPGDTIEVSATKNLKRETELEVSPDRFNLISIFHYFWKDRAQIPETIGCHMLGHTLGIALTREEIAFVSEHLDKKEYSLGGLTSFDRERLVQERVHSSIIDTYDHLFS